MSILPQIRINGRPFILDERLREIRSALNPHEIYLLSQDVIPPVVSPPARFPTTYESESSGLAHFIAALPTEDRNISPEWPRPPFASVFAGHPVADDADDANDGEQQREDDDGPDCAPF